MKQVMITLFAAGVLGAACESPQEPTRSFLRASVSGFVSESYNSAAEFHIGSPPHGGQLFQLSSYRAAREGPPSFAVTMWNSGRPAVGTYSLGLASADAAHPMPSRGITLQYFRTDAGYESQYIVETGELVITHSSERRVEGRFSGTAIRYCYRELVRSNPPVPPEGPCTLPSAPIEGAQRVEVTGTFSAVPLVVGPVEWR